MDFIIIFFRDVLNGPLYIVVTIINTILICSCIGYLGENYLNNKKSKEKYNSTYTTVDNNFVLDTQQQVQVNSEVGNVESSIQDQYQVEQSQQSLSEMDSNNDLL